MRRYFLTGSELYLPSDLSVSRLTFWARLSGPVAGDQLPDEMARPCLANLALAACNPTPGGCVTALTAVNAAIPGHR